jgi:hypothetical protein
VLARDRAELRRQPTVRRQLGEHARMVGRIDDDADRAVVLRRGPQHRGTTDVDHLDDLRVGRTGGDGPFERVEVDDDEVDRIDPELLELRDVVRVRAVGKDAGMHARVERLHASAEALGEAGEVGDLHDLDAGLTDRRGGRSGRDDAHTARPRARRRARARPSCRSS